MVMDASAAGSTTSRPTASSGRLHGRLPNSGPTGSQTVTVAPDSGETASTATATMTTTATTPILVLRAAADVDEDQAGGARSSGPRIQWSEDVVDNEGLGRKSSKGT